MTMLARVEQGNDIADAVYSYLSTRFPASSPFKENTPLLDGGDIDSLGFLELMVFLSEQFNIVLDDEHFDPANLGTPGDLIAFIARERG